MTKFAKFIKSKRQAMGLTQAQFAKKVFGDERRRSDICALETGKKDPSYSSMIAMLEAVKCGVEFTEQ